MMSRLPRSNSACRHWRRHAWPRISTSPKTARSPRGRSISVRRWLAVKGGGSYLPESQVGDTKITLTLPSLAPLSELAGTPLAGSSMVDLTVNTDRDGIKLGWRGTVSNVTADGLPTELVAAPVELSGGATWRFDEAWTVSDARVASGGAALVVAGRGRAATGELDLTLDLPALDFLKAGVGGAAKVTSNIRLGTERTDLRAGSRAQRSRARTDRLAQAHAVGDRLARCDRSGEWRGQGEAAILPPSRCRSTVASRSMPRAAWSCRPSRGDGPASCSMLPTSP